MFDFSALSKSYNPGQLEMIWLEPSHFEQAKVYPTNNSLHQEANRWQLYLNTLALLGFEQWLKRNDSSCSIDKTQCINEVSAIYNLKLDGFRLNLITQEHVLDEEAKIPCLAVDRPHLAAHFHVLIEVSEEQQKIIIRGFIRHDRLVNYCKQIRTPPNGYYRVPLTAFNPRPQHLLFDCNFLEPTAIMPLSITVVPDAQINLGQINLGKWLEGAVTVGWQTINDLFGSTSCLASSLRQQEGGAKRGKLIDLGLQLQEHQAVLLVNVTEEAEQKLAVLVQLHPVGQERYLPAQITLTLLSPTGDNLQEVRARSQDNFIQLRSFKGRTGTLFRLMVSLGEFSIFENFEL